MDHLILPSVVALLAVVVAVATMTMINSAKVTDQCVAAHGSRIFQVVLKNYLTSYEFLRPRDRTSVLLLFKGSNELY